MEGEELSHTFNILWSRLDLVWEIITKFVFILKTAIKIILVTSPTYVIIFLLKFLVFSFLLCENVVYVCVLYTCLYACVEARAGKSNILIYCFCRCLIPLRWSL